MSNEKVKSWVYDIETMKNFSCSVFRNGEERLVFEISSRKDQTKELAKFLKSGKIKYLIGFNNIRFDMQVLQMMLDNPEDFRGKKGSKRAEQLWKYAQKVIETVKLDKFPPYPEYKLDVPQIDLFLINHYNNLNKMTSLKWLEFSMDWKKLQDLPYKHDTILTKDKFDEVINYCINDVDATYEFAKKCTKIVKLRLSQDKEYPDLNLLNKSDSSVGETLFLDYMSEALNIDKRTLRKQQTHHSIIKLSDCVLPYINFKTDTFQEVLDYINTVKINPHDSKDTFKKTVEFGGMEYVFGEGGLHASYKDKQFVSNEEYIILDLDFSSYYPTLAFRNGFYPQHLSEVFCEVYENIYNTRKKIPKTNPNNLSYKLTLNSCYGKAKDIYSFLYDRMFQLKITINGQLILAMFAERLSFIENCQIIQVNTDGISVRVKRTGADKVRELARRLEKLTKLELEEATYNRMVMSDVNNYIAEYENGDVKLKGRYEIDPDWHKNKSQRIVPIALKRFFIDDVPVEETIKNHLLVDEYEDGIKAKGIYDFCIGKKIKSNQNYVILDKVGNETEITDKVIRYYISNSRQRMLKKYSDGRQEQVNSGYDITMFMEYEEKEDYGINYQYYINECNKIITGIIGGNSQIGFQGKLFNFA